MSKDRLEEIKSRAKEGYLTIIGISVEGVEQLEDDMNWLIEQAERVQELETFKEEMENRYKIWQIGAKKSLAEKEELKQQNKRLREALFLKQKGQHNKHWRI